MFCECLEAVCSHDSMAPAELTHLNTSLTVSLYNSQNNGALSSLSHMMNAFLW